VKCFGTEDRQPKETPAYVPSSDDILPFVSFPGGEIKDLYVHEQATAPVSAPAPAPTPAALPKPAPKTNENNNAPPKPPQQNKQQQQQQQHNHQQKPKIDRGSVGTGAHLTHLKERKVFGNDNKGPELPKEEFNMQEALKSFNKEEEKLKLAAAQTTSVVYVKDDFFDNMSSDIVDRMEGKSTNLRRNEERALNVDTFGATGLQSGYRYRGGGRGGGRGYNNNRGRGHNNNRGRGYNNRGRGRGGYNKNQNEN